MKSVRIRSFLFSAALGWCAVSYAADVLESELPKIPLPPLVGSWTFSGMVSNESGDRYGYFFQIQRQGKAFHTKTALIDGQTNQLVLFYEGDEQLELSNALNWRVGRSFMRYNPINDSWVFGIKDENKKGFNFKVDMLKQSSKANEIIELRSGVELQAIQTSSLNGHIHTGEENKEQFVTGNNAWFGRLWMSKDQKSPHAISTTFCRLSNDNGFYSANMKEEDATRAAVAVWRDAAGNKVKMSQFIGFKPMKNNQCLLSVGLPKLNLNLVNTLGLEKPEVGDSKLQMPSSIAGFSKENPKGFCFVTEQSFLQLTPEVLS